MYARSYISPWLRVSDRGDKAVTPNPSVNATRTSRARDTQVYHVSRAQTKCLPARARYLKR